MALIDIEASILSDSSEVWITYRESDLCHIAKIINGIKLDVCINRAFSAQAKRRPSSLI